MVVRGLAMESRNYSLPASVDVPVDVQPGASEIGFLWSLDAPELHASVTSEDQFHCTRLYVVPLAAQDACFVAQVETPFNSIPAETRKKNFRSFGLIRERASKLLHRPGVTRFCLATQQVLRLAYILR